MKSRFLVVCVMLGMGGAAGWPVVAQENRGEGGSSRPAAPEFDRDGLIQIILGTWEPQMAHLAEDGRSWRGTIAPLLEAADEHNLRRAVDMLDYAQMLAVLQGQAPSTVQPQALGDALADLVYTPVTPCRILDTRVAGGVIAADSSRGFDAWPIEGDFLWQGGSDTDCGIPPQPAAVALNITAVNPVGPGYLTAYPYAEASPPLAATLNYATHQIVGNEAVVTISPAGLYHMRIYTWQQTHVVADAVGYFIRPQATPLECVLVTESVTIPGDGRAFRQVMCPAGYTATGGGVETPANAGMRMEASSQVGAGGNGWFTALANENATARTSIFVARCCRVPGR